MENKITTKTTKTELIAMLKTLEAENERLRLEKEGLLVDVSNTVNENCELKDVVYNLRLYLGEVKKADKALWEKLMEKFSGMPGYVAVRAKKKAK